MKAVLLALLLLFAAASAKRCVCQECRNIFPVLWFFKATHTWIYCNCPCDPAQGNCSYSGWAGVQKVGFESRYGRMFGEGALRGEDYTCTDPQPSSVVSDQCGRAAIQLLVDRGWNDNPYYAIIAGATSGAGITSTTDCSPKEKNVCWSFTNSWKDCAVQHSVDDCGINGTLIPERNPSSSGDSLYSLPRYKSLERDEIPSTWTCSPDAYQDGKQCDCNCGTWDPDCNDLENQSPQCAHDEICIPPGICNDRPSTIVDRKYNRIMVDDVDVYARDFRPRFAPYRRQGLLPRMRVPPQWTCPIEYYGSNDGCDSLEHCGAKDPDCSVQGMPMVDTEGFVQ